ncbi:MAG: hypothetical protein AAGB22_08015 [Bacteroidota bacterium]
MSLNLTGQSDQPAQVDPLTGDFSYGLPVLSIPSPNGAFDLSLNYDTNIFMFQEARGDLSGYFCPAGLERSRLHYFTCIRRFTEANTR